MTQLRDSYATQLVVGAAVGGAIVAAPFVGAGLSAASGTLSAAGASVLAAQGKTPSKLTGTAVPGATPVAGQPGSLKSLGPLAGAGVGFVAAGPLGAVIGGAAGYLLGRS
jgi:hypothetical protein